MVAEDGGKPSRSDYTIFTVTVDRNLFDPVLTLPFAPTYENETTVLETVGFNEVIFDVDAADRDVSVSHFFFFKQYFISILLGIGIGEQAKPILTPFPYMSEFHNFTISQEWAKHNN